MKKIVLIRHAKSSWSSPSLSDIKRPLNERGKRDAPFMGSLLLDNHILPHIIYSSPAVRAISTAKIIAKKIKYPTKNIEIKNEIYEASVSDLLKIISLFDNQFNNIMMFGHNPGFSYLVNYLCNDFNNNLPTCGVAELEFDVNNWQEITANSGTLIKFEYPKKYK
jgi:phosphohistidine phosphatase